MNGTRMKRYEYKKKKRKKLLFSLLLLVVTVCLGAVGFRMALRKDSIAKDHTKKAINPEPVKVEQLTKQEIPEPAKPINVAVFGVDNDGFRTDVNFVVSFNEDTKKIQFVSVPRDTRVVMTDEMIASLEQRKKFVPYRNGVKGQCKLTEVHAYAGDEYRNEFSVAMLEDLLGIDIDYFVKIDLDAFHDIVDAVGGVDMEVEQRLYYNDPYQNLYIDLQPGYQHLDGDKAEQLVRFREGYAQKDLKRIQVQQDFMKALLEKVSSTSTILSNLPSIAQVLWESIETDATLKDVLKYAKYIKDIDVNSITMETIPGTGGAYFDYDEEGTKKLVDRVFYGVEDEQPSEENNETEENSNMEENNETEENTEKEQYNEQEQENNNDQQRILYNNEQ